MRKFAVSLLLICLPLRAANIYGKLPLSFEPNRGQTGARVKFLARVPGYTLFVTSDEAVFAGRDGSIERMKLIGANRKMRIEPLDRQPGISNYFIGNDPATWRTNVPNYGRVALRDVYPGIDLIFYGNERQLEYDWVIAPGADPKQIRMKWEGVDEIARNASGDLLLSAALVQKKPVIRQAGKEIEGGYVVRGREVGFEIARYDSAKALVIDPVFFYSTYLGGSGIDQGNGIAVDGSGNVYVTGYTTSSNFPTTNPLQVGNAGNTDAFVTKINAAGSARVYSTYLGGSGNDIGNGIAVDGSGNAYVTGNTSSTDFPTNNSLQASNGGHMNAFVTRIGAAGSALLYSTYLGGNGFDSGAGIAVDGLGAAYVTGNTSSTNFPTANPLQASFLGGGTDAFVTKINGAGSALLYSTYLGGSGDDRGNGIAVDGSGAAYVTGSTTSTNFPTANPVQASLGGGTDAFVTKINAAGSALVYSTYLGGNNFDSGAGIALDAARNTYVAGFTSSTNFPTANPLQASSGGGGDDAFVTKVNAAGSALVYSSYLGGSGDDQGTSIAVDGSGNAYVAGYTGSTDFPTTNPLQAANAGGADVFVTKINASGSARLYSSYLGGSGGDFCYGIAVDGSGNPYVTGGTSSTNFPTANPLQAGSGGGNDAFVVAISSNSAAAAFRDSQGAVYLTNLSSDVTTVFPFNSGGIFASDPSAAQDPAGNTFLVARDNSNGLWLNEFRSHGQSFSGWTPAGGLFTGVPAIAVTAAGTAFLIARDASHAYWLNSFTPGMGFGGWVPLGGSFATDPAIAAGRTCPSNVCTLYLVGKDSFNAIWTAAYSVPGGFAGWNLQGAVANGIPSVTVGVDGAAYIAIRDFSNATWMGRQAGGIFNGWQSGGGLVSTDPQVAGSGGKLYAAALSSGEAWYNTFSEGTGNNWAGWISTGGTLAAVAAAAGSGPQLFLAGRDPSNQLWRYETPGAGWKYLGFTGLAAGPLSAAPR